MSPHLYRRLMREKLAKLRHRVVADVRHMCRTYMQRPPTSDGRVDRRISSLEEVKLS